MACFFREKWITNRMNRTRPQNTQYPRRSRQSCYPLCYMYTVYTTIRRRCTSIGFAGGFMGSDIDWSTRQHASMRMCQLACAAKNKTAQLHHGDSPWLPQCLNHRIESNPGYMNQGDVRTVGIPTYVSDKMMQLHVAALLAARMVCGCGDGSTVPVRATCTRTCS